MKYFLHLSYEGTHYHGWQTQKNASSVQSTIKEAISVLLREDINIMGCGRTDAGVHASQYFAHFNFDDPIPEHFLYKLNRILPKDIVVHEYFKVDEDAHAQKDACSRQYQYFFRFSKSAFYPKLTSYIAIDDLDIQLMQSICNKLIGTHDFESFCTNPHDYPNTYCNIIDCSINFYERTRTYQFSIKGNRFLKSMVRLIVARLIELGSGKITILEFEHALYKQSAFSYKKPAQACGLYLTELVYPYIVSEKYDVFHKRIL